MANSNIEGFKNGQLQHRSSGMRRTLQVDLKTQVLYAPRSLDEDPKLGSSILIGTQEDIGREYRAWVRRNIKSKKKKSRSAVE